MSDQLLPITCFTCGTVFGITDAYFKCRQKDHAGLQCPNGHSNVFLAESREETANKALAAMTKDRDEWREKCGREEARAEKNWGMYMEAEAKLRGTKTPQALLEQATEAPKQIGSDGAGGM